ncbi:MAG: EAL domain-containing protein [Acidimicrobiales bacterium]
MSRPRRDTHRIGALAALFALFAVMAAIFVHNARVADEQRKAALVANVAGRLRSDVERYVSDTTMKANGAQADPSVSLQRIRETATALTEGGPVDDIQGGGEIDLPRPSQSSLLKLKLVQQQLLTKRLENVGRRLLTTEPGTPEYEQALLDLRVVGAQLSSVTGDVVGQITEDNRATLEQAQRVDAVLAALAVVAAIAAGVLFLRSGRHREEARYRALANNSSDLVVVTDEEGTIRYASPSVEAIAGHRREDLEGTSFLDIVHPEDHELLEAARGELEARPEAPVRVEYRLRHADGHWVRVETGWSNLMADPAVRGMVANSRDVSDRHALEEELRRKAFLDDLTGLPNRALFGDRVEQAVQRAHLGNGVVTVLFVDLDDFKTVNDSLGHTTGDHLLVAVAQRLRACVRPTDTAARLGGDEFGVLLSDGSTIDTAESLAERLIGTLREPFEIDGRTLVVTASVGIACQLAEDLTTEAVMRDADVAMYAAKSQGKGRYRVFADRMHKDVVERQRLGSDIQLALGREELEVHYQPLVRLETGAIEGVEALLRWHHPTRGDIPPMTFIPVAEEVGAIIEIGAWVLAQACEQVAAWGRRHPTAQDLAVTVNLSPHQLASERIFSDVADAIQASGIRPSQLVLEITEGALVGDPEEMVRVLQRLRSLGVRLAIDDFGTGYSSLSQLRMLPVDMLKIDKSFVDDTADGGRGTALLHSIIGLGQVLDLDVVAEGIEHPEQAAVLRESGSTYGQGFFYARPASAADLDELLAAGRLGTVDHPA